MTIATTVCTKISRAILRRSPKTVDSSHNKKRDAYQDWRADELKRQYTQFFSPDDVVGLDVVDFGCGFGELCRVVAKFGPKSVLGVELSEVQYQGAVQSPVVEGAPVQPKFLLATRSDTVDLPTASVDVLLCFDVLEHILEYESIIPEWHRVLRKGGKVLVWWVPWWNAFGPHITPLVPIPWAHVLFSEKTLVKSCAEIYDCPEYVPRLWNLDENGNKKPNPWHDRDRLPNVNRLSMRRFERLLRSVGFDVEMRTIKGIGSARSLRGVAAMIGRATELLLNVPFLREFFVLHVAYTLRKSD